MSSPVNDDWSSINESEYNDEFMALETLFVTSMIIFFILILKHALVPEADEENTITGKGDRASQLQSTRNLYSYLY